MTRLLGLIVLAILIWIVLEALLARARASLGGRAPARPAAMAAEALVRCAACGTHVPRSRALRAAGSGGAGPGGGEGSAAAYCSERCRSQGSAALTATSA